LPLLELILARPWEAIAVALGVAYVFLAAKENVLCWPAALVSTAIFSWLFWDVSLLMESALNIYYLAMAIYGWWSWTSTSQHRSQQIHSWSLKKHAVCICLILILALTSGLLLSHYTQAALPFLDSITTWAAVITTYMVAQKILENWLYWVVIDAISIYLYIDRELYLTAMLFAAYVVIAIYGWHSWKKILNPSA
jgi:nicotinamide mononucleotide transporter